MSDPFERIADEWDRNDEAKKVYDFDEERFSRSIEDQARKNVAKANGHAPPAIVQPTNGPAARILHAIDSGRRGVLRNPGSCEPGSR